MQRTFGEAIFSCVQVLSILVRLLRHAVRCGDGGGLEAGLGGTVADDGLVGGGADDDDDDASVATDPFGSPVDDVFGVGNGTIKPGSASASGSKLGGGSVAGGGTPAAGPDGSNTPGVVDAEEVSQCALICLMDEIGSVYCVPCVFGSIASDNAYLRTTLHVAVAAAAPGNWPLCCCNRCDVLLLRTFTRTVSMFDVCCFLLPLPVTSYPLKLASADRSSPA